MIISKVLGGLGNQMFQYAAGRALALRHGVDVRLDTSGFAGYDLHQGFELGRLFHIKASLSTQADLVQVLGWRAYKPIRTALSSQRKLAMLRGTRFAVEPHFSYWEGFESLPSSCYLNGYWQSEKYFSEYTRQVRSDFEFLEPLDEANLRWQARMQQVESSVSLHVRRGDYVSDKAASRVHGVCGLDYYAAAIGYMTSRLSDPIFFVFSDDLDWARKHIGPKAEACFVDCNSGVNSYRDMQLMSMCQHQIIANSSFSWWGAWLNPSLEKIVVAPKRWFVASVDSSDLVPGDWIRL